MVGAQPKCAQLVQFLTILAHGIEPGATENRIYDCVLSGRFIVCMVAPDWMDLSALMARDRD